MKKERRNKGITLIALIITIIVMLILVGVTVNVALNGGLFDAAKQAASGMNMAQIREKAEMVKTVLIADSLTKSDVTANVSTLRNRLLEEFEVTETDTDGNNVIEVNDKYGIVIKNTDLEVEVKEISSISLQDYATALNYTVNNEETNGAITAKNIEITIPKSAVTWEEYVQKALKEEVANIPTETKLEAFLQGFYENQFIPSLEEPLASVDEVIIYVANESFGTTYTTIEECLEDENIQGEWGYSKEELYYGFNSVYLGLLVEEDSELTEQELIDSFYVEYVLAEDYYYRYTFNLKLYVSKDGGEGEEIAKNINNSFLDRTYTYEVPGNGIYEFILKTKDGETIISSEIVQVNDIVTSN